MACSRGLSDSDYPRIKEHTTNAIPAGIEAAPHAGPLRDKEPNFHKT